MEGLGNRGVFLKMFTLLYRTQEKGGKKRHHNLWAVQKRKGGASRQPVNGGSREKEESGDFLMWEGLDQIVNQWDAWKEIKLAVPDVVGRT